MPLPTGVFTSANTGRLQVSFSGQWGSNTGDIRSFGGVALWLRVYIGSGADRQTGVISFNAGESAMLERDYPTPGVGVPVGIEYVGHELSGPSQVGFNKCRITCVLIKR